MTATGSESGPPQAGRRFPCFVFGLSVALLAGVASRLYYAFVFLPRHHGGWGESLPRIIDFDGWSAYARSATGLVFHGLILLGLVVAVLSLITRRRPRPSR